MTLPMQLHALDSENTWSDDFEYDLTPDSRNKPVRGFWTSTYTPDEDFPSDWLRWCDGEQFRSWPKHLLIKPHEDARVCSVVSLKMLMRLPHRTLRSRGGVPLGVVLDFPRIAEHWDAVHLPEDMVYALRYDNHDEAGNELSNFYAWDCESTVWLRKKWDLVGEL